MGRVLSFISIILFSVASYANKSCGEYFKSSGPRIYSQQELEALSPQERMLLALSAKDRFNAYFSTVNKYLKEREYVVDIVQIALLAKEHVLLMGPPGNAKSMISDVILGNIKSENNGVPSYYKIQMTPETTMSETHGPLDYVKLTQTSEYHRIYEEGMLMSKNVFIDEIFDSRANALRNLLVLMNERAHAQGPRIKKGDIETIIAATNRYISEVYEMAGTDGPKAVIDRFAFSVFIPGDLELTQSAVELVQSAKKQKMSFPELTFQDLDKIRSLVSEVEIPDSVAKFLVHLRSRMKEDTEAREESGLKAYKEKVKNGELPPPPYRATKYQSPRTLNKAGGILKAIVVHEWLKSGGARPLRATLDDVKKLEMFFTLNGPRSEFIEQEIGRAVSEHEKVQLMSIKQERETFTTYFDKINTEVNTVIYGYSLLQLQQQMESLRTLNEKEAFSKKLIEIYVEVFNRKQAHQKLAELTGEQIGLETVELFIRQTLEELLGADYQTVVGNQLERIVLEREKAAKAEVEKERARIVEEQRKEAAILAKEAEEKRNRDLAAQKDLERANKFTRLQPQLTIDRNVESSIDILPDGRIIYLSYIEDVIYIVDAQGKFTTVLSAGEVPEADIFFKSKAKFFKMAGPDNLLIAIENTFYLYNIKSKKIESDFALAEGMMISSAYYDHSSAALVAIDKNQNRIVTTFVKNGGRGRTITLPKRELIEQIVEGQDRMSQEGQELVFTSNKGSVLVKYDMSNMNTHVAQIDKGQSMVELYLKGSKVYGLHNGPIDMDHLVLTSRDAKTDQEQHYRIPIEENQYTLSRNRQNFVVLNDKFIVFGGKKGVSIASLASQNVIVKEAFGIATEISSIRLIGKTLVISYLEQGAERTTIVNITDSILNDN